MLCAKIKNDTAKHIMHHFWISNFWIQIEQTIIGIANRLKNPTKTAELNGWTNIAIILELKKSNGKSEKLNHLFAISSLKLITEWQEEWELRLQNFEITVFLTPHLSWTINMLTISPKTDVTKNEALNQSNRL